MTLLPKTLLLLGSGELGKEFAIAGKRIGCKIIACDRYSDAPAMQVADKYEVLDMSNAELLKKTIYKYKPDYVIPEIEALAVEALQEIEDSGITVIPNARATKITMNRDKIRDLASNQLGLKTARFKYASNLNELVNCFHLIGFPSIVKPVMSSSGKGQSLVRHEKEIQQSWETAIKEARGNSNIVIVEELINFNLEITLLTIRQKNGTTIFCQPIGHEQSGGDYQCSWQPAKLSTQQLKTAQEMALKVTDNLGGIGIFGVEFFICGEEVIFSELSPRPHDTGLVTIISQNINEFELHLRAILGLPIPEIILDKPGASRVILGKSYSSKVGFEGFNEALKESDTKILIFGKPNTKEGRRMGVALATGNSIDEAKRKADYASSQIKIKEG